MKVTKKHLISLALVSFWVFTQLFFLTPNFAQATNLWDQQEGLKNTSGEIGPTAFGVASASESRNDVRIIIAKIIKAIFGIMGIVFLILILLAGFKYMKAQGNQEETKEALSQILQATIGLLIMLAAFAITVFVQAAITNATKNVI